MSKSRDAFRTISEVSEWLDTPAHVLRFWESKFSQVKPVKRAGGRRYYRPQDMDLLAGIKKLLHEDGMTIKGVQKLLREKGVKHVAALAPAHDGDAEAASKDITPATEAADTAAQTPVVETKVVAPEKPAEPAAPEAPIDPETPIDEGIAAAKDAPDVTASDETDVSITNVVPMPAPDPAAGPALSVNLGHRPPEPNPPSSTAAPATPATDTPAATIDLRAFLETIPADPSDASSKAEARIFHLMRKLPAEAFASRQVQLTPILTRLQKLRDSIDLR